MLPGRLLKEPWPRLGLVQGLVLGRPFLGSRALGLGRDEDFPAQGWKKRLEVYRSIGVPLDGTWGAKGIALDPCGKNIPKVSLVGKLGEIPFRGFWQGLESCWGPGWKKGRVKRGEKGLFLPGTQGMSLGPNGAQEQGGFGFFWAPFGGKFPLGISLGPGMWGLSYPFVVTGAQGAWKGPGPWDLSSCGDFGIFGKPKVSKFPLWIGAKFPRG